MSLPAGVDAVNRLALSPGIALIAFVILLIAINRSWMVLPPNGQVDAFVYSGFFVDLKHHLSTYDHTYYGSRLPWLLFGAAAHSVADPLTANVLMRMILLALAASAFFLTVRLLYQSAFVAAASSMLLVAHTRFLTALGWDYPDGAGVVLILVSLASVTIAATTPHRRPALLLAGAAMATMVSVQSVLLAALPAQILWLLLLERQRPGRGSHAIPWLIGGALAVTVAYCTASAILGGPILYFMGQARTSVSLDGSDWIRSPGYWVFTGWNALPLVAGLLSVATLGVVIGRRAGNRVLSSAERRAAYSSAVMLAFIGPFLLLQVTRLPVFQWPFYSSYLIPATFLVFASIVATCGAHLSRNAQILGLGLIAALMLAPLSGLSALSACDRRCSLTTETSLAAGVVLVGFIGAILWRQFALVAVSALAIGAINVGIADSSRISVLPVPGGSADLAAAFETAEVLRPFNDGNRLGFWYDLDADKGRMFRSVASMFMFEYQLIGEHFPEFTSAEARRQGERLYPGRLVAILTAGTVGLNQAQTSLDRLGLSLEPVRTIEIERGSVPFSVIVARVGREGFKAVGYADPRQFRAAGGGRVSIEADGTSMVRLNRQQWAYGAELKLPQDVIEDYAAYSAVITVQLEVIDGTVGVGVLNANGSAFLARRSIDDSSDVDLLVPHLGEASNLVVQNWDRATGGRVRIRSVTISVKDRDE